jgi:hypothetical protein
MADYNISANITANTKGYEAGIKKAQTASKSLSKSITNVVKGFGKSGLSGAITSAGLALGGIGLAVGTAVKAIKGITKALGECAEAYKVQLQAERALDTAINNSPFVSGTASKALKDYASQMQKVSNLGDEEIIPQMTQLIATGRTEAEVMKIIATASDMSASGAMSFDQAVTQLNATLNGNIGRLGQQNAELKGLTEEELKSGKAVEILGEKYKGLAKATVDTKKQLQNAIGDLKETFGSVFENAIAPMRKFFAELIQGWADARKAKQDYEQSTKDVAQGTGDIEDYQNVIAGKQKELEDLKSALNSLMTDDWGFPVEEAIRIKNEEIEQAERELEILKAQLDNKIEQQEIAKKQAEEENKRIETEKTVADLKGEYLEKIAEQERKWKNIKTVTGEEVKNEEKLTFYQDTLVNLMTEANGQITTENQLYKDLMGIIKSLYTEEKKDIADIGEWEDKLLAQQIERLETMKELELQQGNGNSYEIETRYAKMILDLKMQQLEKEKELALEKVEGTENAEEARIKIIRYYEEQERLLRVNSSVKTNNQIKEESRKTWKEIAKDITSEMSSVMKKISSLLKNTFGKFKSIFSKMFEFNTDDALVNLLKFEDKVLTFFVETIPKLPAFFESALQSVSVLLQNLLTGGNINTIGNIINAFMKSIARYVPQIVQSLGKIIGTILDQIDFGEIVDWLLNGLISILPDVMKAITNVIKKLVAMLPKILPTLIKAMVSIVTELVKALPSILTSVLPDLLRAVLEMVKALLQHLPEIIKVLIEAIPQIIRAVIEGLIDFISNLSAKDLADIIVGIIKMTADVALTIIKNIGKLVAELIPAMIQLIWELIKSIPEILGGILEGAWEGLQWVGEKVWDGVQSAGKAIASGAEAVWDGIKSALGKLKFWASGTNNAPKGLAVVGEQGPELVRFNGGEQVLNTRNTQKALANVGSNSGNTFNVTFNNTIDTTAYALMQQLKQYNRQMAINSVM